MSDTLSKMTLLHFLAIQLTAKKWPFFVQKWPKNAIFVPKTVFFGLGWSVQLPPTLFRRCPSQNNMCCRVRDPKNR